MLSVTEIYSIVTSTLSLLFHIGDFLGFFGRIRSWSKRQRWFAPWEPPDIELVARTGTRDSELMLCCFFPLLFRSVRNLLCNMLSATDIYSNIIATLALLLHLAHYSGLFGRIKSWSSRQRWFAPRDPTPPDVELVAGAAIRDSESRVRKLEDGMLVLRAAMELVDELTKNHL
ncbi:hypothetical protein F4777DRAFT_319637 [Nemania sp. FL0916]|nr:hypothetical protein F4777DRAFT_319637 [Nemania sp. FL0916]